MPLEEISIGVSSYIRQLCNLNKQHVYHIDFIRTKFRVAQDLNVLINITTAPLPHPSPHPPTRLQRRWSLNREKCTHENFTVLTFCPIFVFYMHVSMFVHSKSLCIYIMCMLFHYFVYPSVFLKIT